MKGDKEIGRRGGGARTMEHLAVDFRVCSCAFGPASPNLVGERVLHKLPMLIHIDSILDRRGSGIVVVFCIVSLVRQHAKMLSPKLSPQLRRKLRNSCRLAINDRVDPLRVLKVDSDLRIMVSAL